MGMSDSERELRDYLHSRPCGYASCKCARLTGDGASLFKISSVVGRVCPGVRAVRKYNSDKAFENIQQNVI